MICFTVFLEIQIKPDMRDIGYCRWAKRGSRILRIRLSPMAKARRRVGESTVDSRQLE